MPALQSVLGEYFEHTAIGGQLAPIGVLRQIVGQPQFLARLVDGIKLVRGGLVGAEDPEVLRVLS